VIALFCGYQPLSEQLRSYQRECLERTLEKIAAGTRAGLWVQPTGSGKTFQFCELARLLDARTLIIVHRDELVQQTVATLNTVWPEATVGIVKAERNEWDMQVTIASVQSLRVNRLEKVPQDRFDLLVHDEAHHLPATTFQRVFDHFNAQFKLGCTATPDRVDGKGLAEWYGPEPLYHYPLKQAIKDGWLVPIRQYAIKTGSVPQKGCTLDD
jgi:superfamily II DNA or RNA helicase